MALVPRLSDWKWWARSLVSSGDRTTYRALRRERRETARLTALPRYAPTVTHLLGPAVALVDAASFLWTYQDVFQRGIYAFRTASERPYIIDAGANIGLSVIYFKRLYPASEIVAFEPDPNLFAILQRNVRAHGYEDVELVPRALWSSETKLDFWQEGADGGRIALGEDRKTATVQTARLRGYLHRPVDLLKLDIEGAEAEVLSDCRDLLDTVARVYVEYHSFACQPQTFPTLVDVLAGAGFRIHLQPCSVARQPFLERPPASGLDMQVHVFGFRD